MRRIAEFSATSSPLAPAAVVIVEGEDRHGEGVNIAARLQQLAEPGGIAVSRNVAEDVKHKLALGFESLGEHQVKNIAEPLSVFRISLDGALTRMRAPGRRGRLLPWRQIAAALVLLIVVGAAVVWYLHPRAPTRPVAENGIVPSLAVLPFANMSSDPALNYFADGVTETL